MEFDIINGLIGLLANGFRVYVVRRFVKTFFHKCDYRWNCENLLYVLFWIGTSMVYEIFHMPVCNLIANVAALTLVIVPYRTKASRKLLSVALIYGVNAIVDSLVIIGFTRYQIGNSINQLFECITSIILLTLEFLFERTFSARKESPLPLRYEISLGAVPVISIWIIYCGVKQTYIPKEMMMIMILGLFFVNILIFFLYYSIEKFYAAYSERNMLENTIQVYMHQLDLVQESQNRVRSLRHDLKHHILELSAMAREDGDEAMQIYLKDMEKFMLNPQEYIATGNQNIDGILNFFLQKAHEVLETVDVEIQIPENLLHNNFKVCTILGNLLDNAIQAARNTREKYLGIKIYSKRGILFLFMKNSRQGEIAKRGEDIRTTKKKMDTHGIGLGNVKRIVEMSGGEMNIRYDENTFEVEILLYMSEIQ